MKVFRAIRRGFARLRRDERGQDAFEYLLATSTVALMVGALIAGFVLLVPEIVGQSCDSVDTAAPTTPAPDGSCLNEAPTPPP